MNAKHTPGPWHYDTHLMNRADHLNVWEQNGIGHVAAVSKGLTPDPSAEANTRLIAAAPDMLEALDRVFVAATRIGRGDVGDIGFAVETIRQTAAGAIAKALGPNWQNVQGHAPGEKGAAND